MGPTRSVAAHVGQGGPIGRRRVDRSTSVDQEHIQTRTHERPRGGRTGRSSADDHDGGREVYARHTRPATQRAPSITPSSATVPANANQTRIRLRGS